MLHSRNTNSKINKLREMVLRLVYHDYKTFEELLEKDKSFILHHYNVHTHCLHLYEDYICLK